MRTGCSTSFLLSCQAGFDSDDNKDKEDSQTVNQPEPETNLEQIEVVDVDKEEGDAKTSKSTSQ